MKRVALINDLSGYGRCSLTVAIAILAHLECEPCPLPTAILSAQTGYKGYTFLDFTPFMSEYQQHWENLNLDFDGIYVGFLGSQAQIPMIRTTLQSLKKVHTRVIIDPIMGDNGKLFSIYHEDYPAIIRDFIQVADIITPNMTEFTLLTGYDFRKEGICETMLLEEGKKLLGCTQKTIVITGILLPEKQNEMITIGLDLEKEKCIQVISAYDGKSYSGTGDIFTSILIGYLLKGYSLEKAIKCATQFIEKVITYTSRLTCDTREGIYYEKFLKEL
jgi:pyridoxine kinase